MKIPLGPSFSKGDIIPPFGPRPRAVSRRAMRLSEPEADPEGKGRLGGI
jgi:hypothetical protein